MICKYCNKYISFWDMWNTVICKRCHWGRCIEDCPNGLIQEGKELEK